MVATITSKGQVTLPIELRRRMHLRAGDKIDFVMGKDGQVRLVRVKQGSIRDLKGFLPKPRKAFTVEEMNDAIAQAAAESADR